MTVDAMISVLKQQINEANSAIVRAKLADDRYAIGLSTGVMIGLENALLMAQNLEVSKRYADV